MIEKVRKIEEKHEKSEQKTCIFEENFVTLQKNSMEKKT